MKEEVDSNDETALSYDKIFKELSKLEKDYRHQETQLKIKNEEVDKYTTTNNILRSHLDNAFAEIENLRTHIQDLEERANEIETTSTQEKEFCEQVVEKLTSKITSMTSEHKGTMEKSNAQLEQLRKEMVQEHAAYVNDLQKQHGEDLMDLEQQIQQESNHSRQLQTKLDFTLEDNLLLQDKLRKVHQEYLPMDAYKSQLKTTSTSNDKLKAQLLHAKNECQSLSLENAHLQKHNERLNVFVNSYDEQRKHHEQQADEQQALIASMQKQLNDNALRYNSLLDECDILNEEKVNLLQDIAKYKKEHCNVEAHSNILEQNRVLQELIKEMQKERLKCTGDQKQAHLEDTEERVKRLEELIHELKKVLISNYLNRMQLQR